MFNVFETTHEWAKQNGHQVETFKATDSTNTQAKSLLSKTQLDKPLFVFADSQSQGKGRGDKTWTSPKEGSSLLFSVAFKLEKPPQPIATPCFGWAVHKAFKESFDLDLSVKAPNDIYIKDKKIAGILLEAVSQGEEHHLVFGLGVNVFSNPNVENSAALIDFMDESEIEENQWLRFFSILVAHCAQASVECQETYLSQSIRDELQKALEAYHKNEITDLEADGSLQLSDGSTAHWRDL